MHECEKLLRHLDNMKTLVLERHSHGEGQHCYHAGFSMTPSTAALSSSCAGRAAHFDPIPFRPWTFNAHTTEVVTM
jgi:hypothetical protein